jgi:hypothetical protein
VVANHVAAKKSVRVEPNAAVKVTGA